MSVSDPLVKELKGWTRKLTECETEITDDNEHLPFFCKSLERCLQKGVLVRTNALGFPKLPEAWYWLNESSNWKDSLFYAFSTTIETVKQSEKVQTPIGRLRLLIRNCLVRKSLHVPIEFLVRTPALALQFYEPNSILGDEILGEIFLSVLYQIGKLNFRLNLRNASFLDDTWQLPDCISLELIPCKTLGISVCFIKGRALIVNLEDNSVAAEDEKIEIGDVLDEINGNVITTKSRGKLRRIMKRAAGQPVAIHIIKNRYKRSNDYYGPIVNLMKGSGIERITQLLKKPKSSEETEIQESIPPKSLDKLLNAGFLVKYCGSVSTGTEGDVRQIERAIWRLLRSGSAKSIPARFECLEIGIRVTQDLDDKVILKQNYMEISSCGRTANIPDYFAFISGDTNCTMATKFEAYIFYHANEEEIQTILQSLGQGFQRTHFAV
ncbi:uncharacterized protein LOC105701613 isoform X2 [Orussus abietinus]|uniref:uncharacterized protein LOC105701613 isoform X2 n=1 Tax=Orussus abietinus TaxID=222816 RepID=UPI000626B8F0|nr:uncharacterized protein LOC105701613 isoform X2 [Orussus abietinus]